MYYNGEPVWAMNDYGKINAPEKISANEAGRVIKESLSALYKERRFLGGFEHACETGTYFDTNQGSLESFTGAEWIIRDKVRVYELVYHGGLIQP